MRGRRKPKSIDHTLLIDIGRDIGLLSHVNHIHSRCGSGVHSHPVLRDGEPVLDETGGEKNLPTHRGRSRNHATHGAEPGYYNLFLAIATIAGIWLWNTAHVSEAVAIFTVTLGSMVAAALVLLFSAGTAMLRGVLLQGLIPAICLALIWRPI